MVHEPLFAAQSADPTWTGKQIVAEDRYLRDIAAELATGAGVTAQQTLLHGKPSDLIVTRALDAGADLIVMTSHGRTGWSRAWMGSVADAVMRGSNVPVLMVRANDLRRDRRALRAPIRRILVPLDGSDLALEALGPAGDLARSLQARVDLVRVVEPVPIANVDIGMPFLYLPNVVDSEATEGLVHQAEQELKREVGRLSASGVFIGEQGVVVSSTPAQAIVDYARGRDTGMIVMTTHGRGRSRLLLGSVAEKVRRATDLPVLVHRPKHARLPGPAFTDESVGEQLPGLATSFRS
jgi:nucleotide-binding universal stress UspA family protein